MEVLCEKLKQLESTPISSGGTVQKCIEKGMIKDTGLFERIVFGLIFFCAQHWKKELKSNELYSLSSAHVKEYIRGW